MTAQTKTGYPSIDRPWLKYYSEEAINAPLPECTIYEYLWENNKDYPNDIAINYVGRKITYGELFRRIDETAAAFLAIGVKPGEIVTVALPSVPEALYCVYALNKIGAVANMIHPLAGEKEILHYLNEVKSRVAVLFDGTYKIMGHAIEQTSVQHAIIVSAGCSLPLGVKQLYYMKTGTTKLPKNNTFQSWHTFIRAGRGTVPEKIPKDSSTMAVISHTGGTTGEPKGVMCSDHNINAVIWQMGSNLPHGRQERCLVVLPPFINYSLVDSMLAMLAFGFEIEMIPNYEPLKFVGYIKKYKPNHISSIPAYWEALLSIPNIELADFSCLNHIYYGGEAMSIEKEAEINHLLLSCGARNELCKGLGSTEVVSVATITYPDCNTPGCAGIPMVKVGCAVCDPDSLKECTYNTDGEICFSGSTVMLGYYENQVATDEIVKIHTDGQRWLHTGDIGYINEDGVVFVTGRIKRILITRGLDGISTKMFPDRIEKALYTHPAVEQCCVVGVPDPQRIHYPKAYIVLKNGIESNENTTNDLMNVCKAHLPEYMVPAEIEYRIELPRTERGKIDYRALEQQAEQKKASH